MPYLCEMSDINVFLIVNLGCEMLYVIDQRLRAQNIALDKCVQVMLDVTGVLLDPVFVDRLIIGSKQKALLTEEHCKFILNDFACCSLMRLDESSMTKLWDLITMVFKWQLEVSQEPQQLLQVTFRHLDGVGQLHPSAKKTMLIDGVKNKIGNFWDSHDERKQEEMLESMKSWFRPLSTKISILIRLGFQNMDGTFNKNINSDNFLEYANNIGENIYNKSEVYSKSTKEVTPNQFKGLAEQLNILPSTSSEIAQTIPMLYFGSSSKLNSKLMDADNGGENEFVQVKTVHTAKTSWGSVFGGKSYQPGRVDLQNLLAKKL